MLSQIELHIMSKLKRIWPLPMGVVAGLAIWAGCQTGRMAPLPSPVAILATNTLEPGPDDPRIAFVAARVLENFHYLEHPLDKEMSVKFFDGYINSLDPHHEYFLQSDLAEFAPYRTNLDQLTINTNAAADLSPAFRIYHRFQERFAQRLAYADELLRQDKFKFNTDEKVVDRRHDTPFPADLDAARQLWSQRVRYDYLMEKLGKEFSESNGVFTIKLPPGAATNIIADLEKHNRWSLRQTDQPGQRERAGGLSERPGPRLRPAHGLHERAARAGFLHQHESGALRHRRPIDGGRRLLHHPRAGAGRTGQQEQGGQ